MSRVLLKIAFEECELQFVEGHKDLLAFLPQAKIKVPLRPAAAGNARPRCI